MADRLTIDEAAAELRKSPRWLGEWLRENPVDSAGVPFYTPAGRTKLFTARDIARISGKIGYELCSREGHVYFVHGGGFVKIGYTASPLSRVRRMLTDCPFELAVLHHEPGTYKTEKALHRQFAHIRVRREWFRQTDELLAFIEKRKRDLTLAAQEGRGISV